MRCAAQCHPSPVRIPIREDIRGKGGGGGGEFKGPIGGLVCLPQCSKIKEGTLWELSPL